MSQSDLWESLALALQKRAYSDRGYGCSTLTVTLLLDRGVLQGWAEPELTHMEPHGQGREILAKFGIVMGQGSESDAEGLTRLEEG